MNPLWCVIDANILLDAVRFVKKPKEIRDPAYAVIEAYLDNRFIWICSQEIIEEYNYQFHKLMREVRISQDKRSFDKKTFNFVVSSIKLGLGFLQPTPEEESNAYEALMAPLRHAELKDPDDWPYLAAAAHARSNNMDVCVVVGSNDSDLTSLNPYQGIEILRLDNLLKKLATW